MEFVYGSKDRIFVNTDIGCKAKCSYCYLPHLVNQDNIRAISAQEAIIFVKNNPLFEKGEEGTILSIGCYSECLDKGNVLKTNELIKHFISYGNYIQLATKQEIPQIIIDTILQHRKFEHQVSIYVSMPTMSAIKQLEEGTASVDTRLRNIKRCVISSIPVVLYIKPFIEGITDKDTDAFLKILRESNIPVIIGDFLSTSSSERIADVGEKKLYERPESIAYKEFIDCFSEKRRYYKHSTEIIEYYRDKRRDINDRRMDK
jgi:radical SAM domain protein